MKIFNLPFLRTFVSLATVVAVIFTVLLTNSLGGIKQNVAHADGHIEITTWEELHNIRDNLAASYVLMNDLTADSAGYGGFAGPGANEGTGWAPIGYNEGGNYFTGSFDGQGYTIASLNIGGEDQDHVGLFGVIQDATLVNITLDGVRSSGREYVGGLVGRSQDGGITSIKNISITNTVRDSIIELNRTSGEARFIGGVGGHIRDADIEDIISYANLVVQDNIGEGISNIGGLFGFVWSLSDSTISPNNLVNHGNITILGSQNVLRVGGLFGVFNFRAGFILKDIEMRGGVIAVSQSGSHSLSNAGGVIGEVQAISSADIRIENAVMRGDLKTHITIDDTQYKTGNAYNIGGLFGGLGNPIVISGSSMYGNVEVVLSQEPELNGWWTYMLGGVAGSANGETTFNDVHTHGDVTLDMPGEAVDMDGFGVGGLLGIAWNLFTLTDSSMQGNVLGLNSVGGLVGELSGQVATITDSYFLGDTISGHDYVGGLVGRIFDSANVSLVITNSSSGGEISGNSYIGGLAGQLFAHVDADTHAISQSYSTAEIVAASDYAGGLIGGIRDGDITNSYATGAVTGNNDVGGLVGEIIDGTITNSYSVGAVTGNNDVGGLVGKNSGSTITNSFWDTQTSGQTTSAGGTGVATELKVLTSFLDVSWNIEETHIEQNDFYPFLAWQVGDSSPVWYITSAPGSVASVPESTTSRPSRSGSFSVRNQVQNLLAQGADEEAQRIKDRWSHLFPEETVAQSPGMSLQEQMHDLQTKLAELLKLYEAMTNQPLETPVSLQTVRDLTVGMNGTDVTALQQLLITQGYSIPAGATGLFVNQTRDALAKYQSEHGIVPAVGYFGSITRTEMKSRNLSGLWW